MAAGLHKLEDEKNILILDIHGREYDVSVLSVSDGILDVHATRGDMNFGGLEIDEEIVNYCVEQFNE